MFLISSHCENHVIPVYHHMLCLSDVHLMTLYVPWFPFWTCVRIKHSMASSHLQMTANSELANPNQKCGGKFLQLETFKENVIYRGDTYCENYIRPCCDYFMRLLWCNNIYCHASLHIQMLARCRYVCDSSFLCSLMESGKLFTFFF